MNVTLQSTTESSSRLAGLMHFIGNASLEGDACPKCSGLVCSYPDIHDVTKRHSVPIRGKGRLERKGSLFGDEQHGLFVCNDCNTAIPGCMLLADNGRGASLFEALIYDPASGFRTMVGATPDYMERLRNSSATATFQRLFERVDFSEIEDGITSTISGLIEQYFSNWVRDLFPTKDTVRFVRKLHAGRIESGRSDFPPSGADLAIWFGTLSEADVALLDAYDRNRNQPNLLPDKIGSGVLVQAKKTVGKLKLRQLFDFESYASLQVAGAMWPGLSGKLFAEYNEEGDWEAAFFGGQHTEALLNAVRKVPRSDSSIISFGHAKSLWGSGCGCDAIEFVEAILTANVGSPLLSLNWVLAHSGPAIIVGVPQSDGGGPGGFPPGGLSRWLDDTIQRRKPVAKEESMDATQRIAEAFRVIRRSHEDHFFGGQSFGSTSSTPQRKENPPMGGNAR